MKGHIGTFGPIVTDFNRVALRGRLTANVLVLENGCWEWQKHRLNMGYGRMSIGEGRMNYAHRIAYELYIGPIPAGLQVAHRCDNPPCCNPDHLFTATSRQNTDDATSKGRIASARNGFYQANAERTFAHNRRLREARQLPK